MVVDALLSGVIMIKEVINRDATTAIAITFFMLIYKILPYKTFP